MAVIWQVEFGISGSWIVKFLVNLVPAGNGIIAIAGYITIAQIVNGVNGQGGVQFFGQSVLPAGPDGNGLVGQIGAGREFGVVAVAVLVIFEVFFQISQVGEAFGVPGYFSFVRLTILVIRTVAVSKADGRGGRAAGTSGGEVGVEFPVGEDLAENVGGGAFGVLGIGNEVDVGVEDIIGDVGGIDVDGAAVPDRFIAVNRERLGRAGKTLLAIPAGGAVMAVIGNDADGDGAPSATLRTGPRATEGEGATNH
ncbi:hypothetical protein HY798_01450 [Candidatus Falkowbacteria bacterium]|nr:hypothetical protein [Candidatus Falkowbacteria bacterium]